jgi:hypothetical protein
VHFEPYYRFISHPIILLIDKGDVKQKVEGAEHIGDEAMAFPTTVGLNHFAAFSYSLAGRATGATQVKRMARFSWRKGEFMNPADFFWYGVAVSLIVCIAGFLALFRHADKAGEKLRRKRFMASCAIEFVANGQEYSGLSSNCSLNGLFIRTQVNVAPGTMIDASVHLPNGAKSHVRGRVARVLKSTRGEGASSEEGIGLAILECEPSYRSFIKSLQEAQERGGKSAMSYSRDY